MEVEVDTTRHRSPKRPLTDEAGGNIYEPPEKKYSFDGDEDDEDGSPRSTGTVRHAEVTPTDDVDDGYGDYGDGYGSSSSTEDEAPPPKGNWLRM